MMHASKFSKVKENFTCEHCGFNVVGSGYTNHCPRCLWSKHVDVNPGDRASQCNGMMEPISLEQKAGEYRILHRCIQCGFEKPNVVAENDNKASLVNLSRP